MGGRPGTSPPTCSTPPRTEEYFWAWESVATALGGLLQWGKLHTREADYLAWVYPRFRDSLALRDELDPARRFSNPYLEQVLGT